MLPVVVVAAVTIALPLAAIRVPDWYEPVHVGAGQLQAVRDDLSMTYERINVAMQSDGQRSNVPFVSAS